MITAAQKDAQRNRNTIFVEDGEILGIDEFPGDQFIMHIRAPKCAVAAQPGSFVHVTCDYTLPLRRPLSIMRVENDCIDILYKIVGDGLRWLSKKRPGDLISVLGPIGQPFRPSAKRPKPLLIGGGVGIPPMVFIADYLRQHEGSWEALAILGSELPFPFEVRKSTVNMPWVDEQVSATMPLLEDWGIPCRLATLAGFDGCFDGYVTDLADRWLATLYGEDQYARRRSDEESLRGRSGIRRIDGCLVGPCRVNGN